ncbi:hypothetical protein JIG36_44475 [Actinoplanes sp. LDG1-06]|uniref:Uncharacterized protein n=1 Tax=Paractinoplanes ovalisporus TaxID=2810368 RepID=A0ABS2ARV0_9ACTN|nr:hypothetical protein [Actinoplanes ovalisporus]MBM2622582.1 hypothetical protein [Actinoplanes ovalisporus]
MTNWMTAAGIALIAGGLATLICFRTVLFGGGGRRARDQAPSGIQPKSRRARGTRRRNRSVPEPALVPVAALAGPEEDDPLDGLASIGLAEERRELYPEDREYPEDRDYVEDHEYADDRGEVCAEERGEPYAKESTEPYVGDRAEPYVGDRAEPYVGDRAEPYVGDRDQAYVEDPDEAYAMDRAESYVTDRAESYAEDQELFPYEDELPPLDEPALTDVAEPAYNPERYGDRVEGWVRPEYRHVPEQPPSGEYWTPIPVELELDPEPSAKGYGWPMAVERLPAVPDYEPATGFDLAPIEHEPTEIVTPQPRGRKRRERPSAVDRNRINLPRSWSARDDKADEPAAREWRVGNDGRRRGDATELFAAVTDEPPRSTRRRPRPRPRPAAEPSDRSTTMYVSRHAAEPPPR